MIEETSKSDTKQKVLVVEDDEFLRDLLVKKLLNQGFDAKDSVDSKTAFAVLAQSKQDIILLDLILPDMDGFEILEKIKADEKHRATPVLILSNHGQPEDVDRVMALGAYDFMVKANHTLDEIVEKVQNVLKDTSTLQNIKSALVAVLQQ